jgi:CARDB
MKRVKYILAVIMILTLSSGGYCTQKKQSKKLQKEWKNFLESQIPDADKAFLDNLAVRFQDIGNLNANANRLFRRTILKQLNAKQARSILRKHSKPYMAQFAKGRHPLLSVEQFTDYLDSREKLKSILDNILMLYERCYTMPFNPGDDPSLLSTASGTYHYLNIKLRDFENDFDASITQLLDYAGRKYDILSEYAANHETENLLINARMLSGYFENAELAVKRNLTHPIEISNQSWINGALLNVINIVDSHFALNAEFCKLISLRIAKIKTPRPPTLPDLTISDIELKVPKEVMTNKTMKVIIEIKNIGDLTAARSKVKIIMPNGSKRKFSSPALLAGKTYKKSLSYRIKAGGDNVFTAVVNHNENTLESDYTNNAARRSLILPMRPE